MCEICLGINSHLCPECGEQLDKVYCPECRGTGYRKCFAVSTRTSKEIEVMPETFMALPESEDVARMTGKKYYRSYGEECGFCGGIGEIWQDQRGDFHKIQ